MFSRVFQLLADLDDHPETLERDVQRDDRQKERRVAVGERLALARREQRRVVGGVDVREAGEDERDHADDEEQHHPDLDLRHDADAEVVDREEAAEQRPDGGDGRDRGTDGPEDAVEVVGEPDGGEEQVRPDGQNGHGDAEQAPERADEPRAVHVDAAGDGDGAAELQQEQHAQHHRHDRNEDGQRDRGPGGGRHLRRHDEDAHPECGPDQERDGAPEADLFVDQFELFGCHRRCPYRATGRP